MEVPTSRAAVIHLRRPVAILIWLVATFGPLPGIGQPARVCVGESSHPVVTGEAWLVANRWGAYPSVLVATIRNGKFDERRSVQFPQYWEQAFDYKLLLAIADQPVEPPASLVNDFAFSPGEAPEYWKRFSTIYLSPPLVAKNLGKDWPTALVQIGRLTGGDLVLPVPTRRTIRLIYPGGRPLAGARGHISLYGSSENHCGVAVGIDLGAFTTNTDGAFAVVAPNSSLALSIGYFEEEADGPAGVAYSARQDVIVGAEPMITVKRLWTLPQCDYVLRCQTAKNQPIAHAHLTACMNFDGCGAGCGPIRAPESDAAGTIRFRAEDLREMRSLTVVSIEGKERNPTDAEMHDLLSTYRVNLRWD
jgi:hypothetical protein